MSRKPRLYIAYGSNLNLPQMAFRCPTAEVVGASELKDYELLAAGVRSPQWSQRKEALFRCFCGKSNRGMKKPSTGMRDIPAFMTSR